MTAGVVDEQVMLPPGLSPSRIPSVSHSLPPPADYRRQQSCDRAHQIHPCFLFLPFLSCQKTTHSRINTCLITSKTACAIYSYDTYNTNKIKPQIPSGLCIDHTQLDLFSSQFSLTSIPENYTDVWVCNFFMFT